MNDQNNSHRPIDLVIASAGTGKTTRLVDEIRSAIEAGVDTRAIMATTFTNKAADELIERARAYLIAKGKSDQAAGLLAARVGTVNATFGKMVGEFALNAGRSPVADVISEQRQKWMFAVSAEVAIARHAAAMIPIAQRLEVEDWTDDVRSLADQARQNNIDPARLAEHATQSWTGFQKILPTQLSEGPEEFDASLREAIAGGASALSNANDTTKKTADTLNRLREAIAVLDSGRDLTWSWWVRLAKLSPAKSSEDLVRPVTDIAGRHAAHPKLHRDIETYIHGVYETAAEALDIYTRYKAENGLVDFVDQEHQALQLLDDPYVSARLGETVRRVFVDEFQDTSPIQLALFLKMSQIAERCFWVGDPKQAIYGFRGSDPELIEKAAAEIVPRSGGQRDTLNRSYRSRPGLVDLANHAFGPAFETLGFDPEAVRVKECVRNDGEGQTEPVETWALSGKNWDLAIAALAERVLSILENPDTYLVEDRTLKEVRPIRGSDIAILCRSNKRCIDVGAALAATGLRVSIARPGLLDTPEAALAVAALRYLVDPGDSLAIAEIAHFFDDGEGQPAWFARSLSEHGIRSLCAELPALVALDEAREELAYLTPREALEIAMTTSGVLDQVRGWPNPFDRIGNLDALRGLTTQYEDEARTGRGAATAAGLVTWLANAGGSDSELPPSKDPAAVNVLTYHGAKGLEWPMVVLLDLDSARPGSAFGFSVEAAAADTFDVWRPLEGRWVRYWPWPYGQQRKDVHIDGSVLETSEHREAVRRQHAESVRLLYVGMTRARDYLVLAPRYSSSKGFQASWLEQLADGDGNPVFNFASLESDSKLIVGGHAIPVHYALLSASDEADEVTPASDVLHQLAAVGEKPNFLPYQIVPSAAQPDTGTKFVVADRLALGERIPMSGNADMTQLGEAVHAFLAFDRPDHNPDDRASRAEGALSRWNINAVSPEQLVEMSDRLFGHLTSTWPDMLIRAEVPVFGRRDGQRVNGRIDLLLHNGGKAVIVDHKTYPGGFDTWEQKALGFGPQLDLYASVVREATGCANVETWVHMPIVGQLICVCVED